MKDVKRIENGQKIEKEYLESENNEIELPELFISEYKMNDIVKEFLNDKQNTTNTLYIVPAKVLFQNRAFNIKYFKKIFVPRKTNVYNKGGSLVISNAFKTSNRLNKDYTYNLSDFAFFTNLKDAEIFSYELANIILSSHEKYMKREDKILEKGYRKSFLIENDYIKCDERLLKEVHTHLKHCKNSLFSVHPEYYL